MKKKIFLSLLIFFIVISCASCKKCNDKGNDKEPCVNHIDKNNDKKCDVCGEEIKITCSEHKDANLDKICDVCGEKINDSIIVEPPKPQEVMIGIEGSSEVRSGKTITLKANVTSNSELADKTVEWQITKGSEFASITSDGVLTANEVTGDKVIEITAISNANKECSAKKIITILSKPVLTDEMLNVLKEDKIAFEGYINISLYNFGIINSLYSTYTTVVKTAMDGTNWYAEYENGNTGLTQGAYYKKNNDLACQVGVNFMNEEEYFPLTDEYGKEISWHDGGLYNVFKELDASDFTFDEKSWRYVYTGYDESVIERMIASANPYDFDPTNLALIIEDGEIYGIYSLAKDDYTIAQGYRAVQELYVAINYGETVEVPSIAKYSHEEIHDDLAIAIDNMQKLDNYTLNFHEMTVYYGSSLIEKGFTEQVTNDNCFFRPYDISYNSDYTRNYIYADKDNYGYKKINDNLYNTYTSDGTGNNFSAVRAYNDEFNKTKPSFAFAPEIFREYYVDEETGETTYYVDDLMSGVATTFYYGVGNDIALYGIFATRGYTSETTSFTPYVTVKDGYIINAGFYFNITYLYGVVELEYTQFNETTINSEINFEFETREVPTSWSQLQIEISNVEEEKSMNALEYFKNLFKDENIDSKLPFFGNAIGDTYGFGLTTKYLPAGENIAKDAVVLYYDVPLDTNSTIESSLKAVETYLLSLGFTKNIANNYFVKDNIHVAPTDTNLDFMIYIW